MSLPVRQPQTADFTSTETASVTTTETSTTTVDVTEVATITSTSSITVTTTAPVTMETTILNTVDVTSTAFTTSIVDLTITQTISTTKTIAATVTSTATSSPTCGVNLVSNPSFSGATLSPWTWSGTNGGRYSFVAEGTTYAINLYGTGCSSAITQTLATVTGETYTFSMHYYLIIGVTPNTLVCSFDNSDGTSYSMEPALKMFGKRSRPHSSHPHLPPLSNVN
ncbi:hypothetical protein N7520_007555 [Penicillium odoratum]|uniref:uncharacterized protein n=1 Tax=Penicillium odoratum TaxID=1167516 RepID=UPI0025477933|nr:uncharacterized protein N7520_007555 [Penicillium odoratum]KAJ5760399.1 hypothetical protein N7520_007555 [Penicillium odoratum]